MTNRECLNKLPNNEFIIKIKKLVDCQGYIYVNWDKWLNDTNGKSPCDFYKGEKGFFSETTRIMSEKDRSERLEVIWKPCLILDYKEILSTPYATVYDPEKKQIFSLPKKNTRIKKKGDIS